MTIFNHNIPTPAPEEQPNEHLVSPSPYDSMGNMKSSRTLICNAPTPGGAWCDRYTSMPVGVADGCAPPSIIG